MSPSVSRTLAGHLLEIKAIQLDLKKPFVWASGWKSPIYCDNRISLSYPLVRTFIKENLARLIKDHFPGAEVIAGVATAGIPQGALIADFLGLPLVYVRSKPKGHGMKNMIEGHVVKGKKAVLVEDLISTGGSSIKAAEALRSAGIQVCGLAAIFTYGFEEARINLENANLQTIYLSSYGDMLEEAVAARYIKEKELVALKSWRTDPAHWGPSKF